MRIIKNQIPLSAWETEEWKQSFQYLGPMEQVVFMDIETTGFSRSYDSVYLIGYLYYIPFHSKVNSIHKRKIIRP